MKNSIFTISVIFIISLGSFAQNDPITVFDWESKINDHIRSDTDSAEHYLNSLDTTNFGVLEVHVYNVVRARVLYMKGRSSMAMPLLLKSSDFFKENKHYHRLAEVYDDIAYLNQKLRQHEDHRAYAERAIAEKKRLGDDKGLSRSYNLLANYYLYNDPRDVYESQTSNAEINYRRGISHAIKNSDDLARNLNGLARVFFIYYSKKPDEKSLLDSAKHLYKISREICMANGNLKDAIYSGYGLFQLYSYLLNEEETNAEDMLPNLILMSSVLDTTKLSLDKIKDTELLLTQTKHESYLGEAKASYYDSLIIRIARDKPTTPKSEYYLYMDSSRNSYKKALKLKKKHYDEALRYNSNRNIERVQEIEEEFKRDTTVRALENRNLNLELDSVRSQSQRNLFVALALFLLLTSIFIYFWFKARLQKRKLENVKSVLEGQENERRRIARDLHDGVGVLLTAAQRQIESLENGVVNPALLSTVEMMNDASQEVRKVAHNMMPGTLTKLGLEEALEDLFDRIRMSSTLKIDSHFEIHNEPLGESSEIMIYRIVQELTNNTLKYANATHLNFTLKSSGQFYEMTYQDDGQGFVVSELEEGIGIKSIYSRTDFLGGKVNITSQPNEGVLFSFKFPVKRNRS